MKQNKKGFTLVELLAIIIVIAVISLISIPIITNIIEKSRIEAFKSSLYQLFNSVQYYMEEKGLDTFPEDGIDVKELNLYKETTLTMGLVLNKSDKYYLEYVSNGKYCGTGTKRDLIIYKGKCDTSIPACSLKIENKYVGDNKWYGVRPKVTMETSAAKASGLSYGIGYVENYSKSIKTSKRGTATFEEVRTGVTEVNCYVKTASDNKGTNKIEIKVDETAPTEADFNYTTTSNSITVVANGTDNESGIARYQFSNDDGNNWYPTVPQKSNVYTFNKLNNKTTYPVKIKLYNGTYTEEKELSNHKESATKQVTLVSLLGPTYEVEGGWKNTSKNAKILYTGEGTYLFMVDKANVTANVDLNNCGTISLEGQFNCSNEVIAKNTVLEADVWYRTTTNPILSFPVNGSIIAKTADGVNSEQSSQNINGIDKESPTCISSGGSTTWYNANRTIYGTCSDTGGSGCVGNIIKEYTATGEKSNQSPGTVYDNAGNSTTCPANQLIRIDKESPICVTSSSHSGWINQDVTLTGTCSDTGGSGCVGSISKKYTSEINQNQSPGTVYDNAGNITVCPTNLVQIDKTSPVCTNSGGSPGVDQKWSTQTVTIVGTCNDNNTGGSGCKNLTNWSYTGTIGSSTYTANVSYSNGNVSKTFNTDKYVYAQNNQTPGVITDNAGNSTTCAANQNVFIDKTAPIEIPEYYLADAQLGHHWYIFYFYAGKYSYDDVSSAHPELGPNGGANSIRYVKYQASINNGAFQTMRYNVNYFIDNVPDVPFTHLVRLRAINNAGLIGPIGSQVTVDPLRLWIVQAYKYCLNHSATDISGIDYWYSYYNTSKDIARTIYNICGNSEEAWNDWQGVHSDQTKLDNLIRAIYRGTVGREARIDSKGNDEVTYWRNWFMERTDKQLRTGFQELVKMFINSSEFRGVADKYNLAWNGV